MVTTDGMEKNSCSLVEMLDSGAPGWDSGGEILLFTADGCWEFDWWGIDGIAGILDARYAWRLWLVCWTVWLRACWVSRRDLTEVERRCKVEVMAWSSFVWD